MRFLAPRTALLAFFWLGLSAKLEAQSRQLAAQAGIDEGGLVLGANFDLVDTPTENYGAYFRLYSKDNAKGAPAIFALGANFRGHARHGLFDFYVAPGFGILHHNANKTRLLLGPSLAFGLSADLDKSMALGIENTKLYSWVGDVRGLIKDTFLASFHYKLP